MREGLIVTSLTQACHPVRALRLSFGPTLPIGMQTRAGPCSTIPPAQPLLPLLEIAMPTFRPTFVATLCGLAIAQLSACGGGGTAAHIGGTVSGLASGATLALSDGRATALSVSANGAFVFDAVVPDKASYSVAVVAQPTGQTCSVNNGTGIVAGSDVNNVLVSCANNVLLSGTVSGLPAGASVTLGDGQVATVLAANGLFTLKGSYPAGGSYAVNVSVAPSGTNCTLANGMGSVSLAGDPVTNLAVSCTATGSLGGMIGGLPEGSSLVLSNGVSSISVSANGAFAFPDVFNPNDAYAVTQLSQIGAQTCTIGNAAGTFDAAATAINTLVVTCN